VERGSGYKQLLRSLLKRAKGLWGLVAALCGAIVLVASTVAVVTPHSGDGAAPQDYSAADASSLSASAVSEAAGSFWVTISKACSMANDVNAQAKRDGRALKKRLSATQSPSVAKAAVIRAIDSTANALLDETVLLRSASPPESLIDTYDKALVALDRNVSWVQSYAAALSGARSPTEAGRVFRRFERRMPTYQTDRARFRAALLKMGAGRCELSRTLTIDPVLAPTFLATIETEATPSTQPSVSPVIHKVSPYIAPRVNLASPTVRAPSKDVTGRPEGRSGRDPERQDSD
jgi:hypothetical protein